MTHPIESQQAHVLKILIAEGGIMERDPLKDAYAKVSPGRSLANRLHELEQACLLSVSGSGAVSITYLGLREYKLQCDDRFSPEFYPSGWRAMKPLTEELPRGGKFQVTDARLSGRDGEVLCWMEVHRWHRTNWLGLILPPKRERFFMFSGKFAHNRACSGWCSMQGHESVDQMLARFGFKEVVPG